MIFLPRLTNFLLSQNNHNNTINNNKNNHRNNKFCYSNNKFHNKNNYFHNRINKFLGSNFKFHNSTFNNSFLLPLTIKILTITPLLQITKEVLRGAMLTLPPQPCPACVSWG